MTNTLPPPFAVGRTAEIFAWKEGTVLKLYRDWCPSNWVEHEAHIAAVVVQAGLPAPRAYGIEEVNGRRGLVYERVDGESMLQTMRRRPYKLAAFGCLLADLHLEMHRQGAETLPDQRRQLEHSIASAKALPDDLRAAVFQALARLPGGDRLCHGDFHPDNVVLTVKGPVILDWMTANHGNPWADVARSHLLLTLGQPQGSSLVMRLMLLGRGVFYRAYLRRYQASAAPGGEQLQAWIPVMAAARLNEEIAHETPALLQMIRAGLGAGAG
jgi:aminoglycoside phosphotransferase (APT) family kinase protein